MGPKKGIFQKFQAAPSNDRLTKDYFNPFTNAGKLEGFERKSRVEVLDMALDESGKNQIGKSHDLIKRKGTL